MLSVSSYEHINDKRKQIMNILPSLQDVYWDEDYLLKTTRKLISIKAVNELPKVTDYTQIVEYIKNELHNLGLETVVAGQRNFPNNGLRKDGSKIAPVNAIHKMNKFINYLLDVDSWMHYEPSPFTGRDNGMYSDKPNPPMDVDTSGQLYALADRNFYRVFDRPLKPSYQCLTKQALHPDGNTFALYCRTCA